MSPNEHEQSVLFQANDRAACVVRQLPGGSLAAAREAVTGAAVDVLAAYRRHCASQSSSAQLILPEALKLMPLYTLALLKSPALGCAPRAVRVLSPLCANSAVAAMGYNLCDKQSPTAHCRKRQCGWRDTLCCRWLTGSCYHVPAPIHR